MLELIQRHHQLIRDAGVAGQALPSDAGPRSPKDFGRFVTEEMATPWHAALSETRIVVALRPRRRPRWIPGRRRGRCRDYTACPFAVRATSMLFLVALE